SHASSSESSALMSWQGEDIRCGGQSLSPYVCTAPPGPSYWDQNLDPSLAPRTPKLGEVLMRVSHLEETNTQLTSTLEQVTDRLDKAKAHLKALEDSSG